MREYGERLGQLLEGQEEFLEQRELVHAGQRPYLVRWVKDSLLFARRHGGYTFEQTLDMYLSELGGRKPSCVGRFCAVVSPCRSIGLARDESAD